MFSSSLFRTTGGGAEDDRLNSKSMDAVKGMCQRQGVGMARTWAVTTGGLEGTSQ